MLRIQATIGATTYYFASEALDYADRYWEPRISNAFQLTREFNSADKTGNKIRTAEVSLDNRDGFFNSIYTADGLVNGKFVLYFNEGDNVVKTFTARVNKINSFGDDISLSLREVGYEYLTRKFPDAQIAYDYYSTSGVNDSWNAIPIHLGTVNRYPCPWINLFESHFMIGSGPIHAVKKIYFDKTVVYDSSTGQNGYKATPESPEIKFRIFKGARAGYTDVVEGVTSSYPGFAYIQLYKIVDSVEQPADPVNPDGESVQIYVDIEGLQNEAGNAAERNPAQILYQFFTKPYTAEEGYGLAVDPGDLDFAAAITECAIQGFKIDGSIDNTTDFGEWIDEILRCCRGQLYETGGKISVRIDAAAAAPSVHFDETGELGYNCIVDTWNEPERDAQTNRVRLSYSWNFENSNFNKKPSYNQESPIGDTHLQNPTHANRIQKWNTETLEYKLIKDDTTAHKLAQYYLNNIVKQLITTSLTTEVDIPATVDAGTVVKVTSPKFGWNQKLFRITSISRSEENTEIQLKEYDASVFTFYDPGTGAETSNNQYSVYNIPAKPKMTSLTVVNSLMADGSTQTRINVNFIAPTENSQLVALYYKTAGGTEADFRPLDTALSSAGTLSAIWKGIESGNYNFRLVTISPVGIYSDLSIVSGDKHYYGQPGSETTVALTGDTIEPEKPLITDYLIGQGVVTLSFDITGGVPSDFSHFAVYRKLNGGSLELIDAKYTGRLFTDTDVASYVSRQYSIVAYDKTGNASVASDLTIALTPLKIATNDIQAGAITSETITTDAIYGKCFMTNCNVGNSCAGVIFDSAGIRAYSTTANTFNLDAMTGNVSMTGTICALCGVIGGFTVSPTDGLYAGTGSTRVQMKPGAGFWAGATAQVDALFSVDQAGNLRANAGSIAGWDFNASCISKTIGIVGGFRLDSSIPALWILPDSTGFSRLTMGKCIYWYDCWKSVDNGFAITGAAGENLFMVWGCSGTTCAQIAGWNFNQNALWKSRDISSTALGYPGIYIGATHDGITTWGSGFRVVSGVGGEFAVSMGCCLLHPGIAWCAMDGILIADQNQGVLFKVGKYHSDCSLVAQIAGWNFNATTIYKGVAGTCVLLMSGDGVGRHGLEVNSNCLAVSIGRCLHAPDIGYCAMDGILASGAGVGGTLFKIGKYHSDGSTVAQIAGWDFTSTSFCKGSGTAVLSINSVHPTIPESKPFIWIGDNSGANHVTVGGSHYANGWTHGKYGIQVTSGSLPVFTAYACCDGTGGCFNLAGWNFTNTTLSKSPVSLFADEPTYHRTGMEIAGASTYISIGCCLHYPGHTICAMTGMMISDINNGVFFKIGQYHSDNSIVAQIAGWSFNSQRIYKGCGLGVAFNISTETTGSGYFYESAHILQGYSMTWLYGNNAGHLVMGQIAENATTIKSGYYGFQMMDHVGHEFFALAAKQGYNCYEPYNRIAGWAFNSQCIYSNNIILNYAGSIQTADFVAGNKGWKIDCAGNAEFNNICARGAIRTAVFIKDQISVVGGCTLIRPAVVICQENCACNNYSFIVEPGHGFQVNDVIRAKDTNGNDFWGVIYATGDNWFNPLFCGGNQGWLLQKGQAVVNYGKANSGGIMLNGQCPYIDLYTHNGTPWNGTCSRVRIGNLNGWGDISSNVYGFAVGSPSGSYLRYDATSSELRLKGVINIVAGSSGIGSFSDANIDNIADGATYKRTTEAERQGGCKGYYGLVMGNISGLQRHDTRSQNYAPFWYPMGVFSEFKLSACLGISGANGYGNLTTDKPWPDSSGGYAVQTYKDSSGIWERSAPAGDSSWGAWHKITDGVGSLVSRVIPSQNAAPTGAGLHLGADYLGYYDGGTWKSYMDNCGHFYLSGTTGGLAWDGSTLTVCGTVCSCAGNIGGWNISDQSLWHQDAGGGILNINVLCSSIYTHRPSPDYGEWQGQIYNNGWTGRYGFAVTRGAGVYLFRSDTDVDGNNACNQIAGWDFDNSRFYKDSGSGGIFIHAASAGNHPGISIIGHHSGCSYITFGGDLFNGNWLYDHWGLVIRVNNQNLFQVHAKQDGSYQCANIAGWNFNAGCLYSGNLIINSAGSITGNYNGDVSGWCIDAAGNAKFNNATVRGTVCASQGYIGCFLLQDGRLNLTADSIFDGLVFCRTLHCTCISISTNLIWMCSYEYGYLACSTFGPSSVRLNKSPDSFSRNTYLDAGCVAFKTYMSNSPYSSVCSSIYICSILNGVDAANSSFTICTQAGNGCYAMCTNGRIFSNGINVGCQLDLPSIGTGRFGTGTGDGSTFSIYNTYLSGWNGMAFINESSGGAYPYGVVGLLDFRNGHLCMKGTVYGNCLYGDWLYSGMSRFGSVCVGLDCISSRGLLKIVGSHTTTIQHITATSYSGEATHADMFLWASEPGKTYSGTGISNNYYYHAGTPYNDWTRKDTARGGSFIRLLDGDIKFNIITSAGNIFDILALSDGNHPTDANATVSNGFYYANANVGLYGQTDGALYVQAHSSSWQGQIYQDYSTGQLAVRGKNNGTWTTWLCIATNGCRIIGCSGSCAIVGYAYGGVCGVVAVASTYGLWAGAGNIGIYAEAGTNYAIRACAYSCYGVFATASCCYGIVGCVVACYGVIGCAALSGVYGVATTAYPVAGNGAYYNASTRTLKQNFEDIYVLPGLRTVCIQKWTWADANQRGFDEFVAPVAEEVQRAWGLTFKDDGYYTLDGIALKAAQEIDENVQVIDQNVQVHESCIAYLKDENIVLKSCIEQMSCKLKLIEERLGLN